MAENLYEIFPLWGVIVLLIFLLFIGYKRRIGFISIVILLLSNPLMRATKFSEFELKILWSFIVLAFVAGIIIDFKSIKRSCQKEAMYLRALLTVIKAFTAIITEKNFLSQKDFILSYLRDFPESFEENEPIDIGAAAEFNSLLEDYYRLSDENSVRGENPVRNKRIAELKEKLIEDYCMTEEALHKLIIKQPI